MPQPFRHVTWGKLKQNLQEACPQGSLATTGAQLNLLMPRQVLGRGYEYLSTAQVVSETRKGEMDAGREPTKLLLVLSKKEEEQNIGHKSKRILFYYFKVET